MQKLKIILENKKHFAERGIEASENEIGGLRQRIAECEANIKDAKYLITEIDKGLEDIEKREVAEAVRVLSKTEITPQKILQDHINGYKSSILAETIYIEENQKSIDWHKERIASWEKSIANLEAGLLLLK